MADRVSLERDLIEVIRIARSAGEIIRPYFGGPLRVEHKGALDLVTEADRASEELILRELAQSFPGEPVLSEEAGMTGGESDVLWVTDPLDGTTNFSHGHPVCAVSIARLRDGRPDVGVVCAPMLGELWSAARGAGTWLNQRPCRVSAAAEMKKALLATGFPYDVHTPPHRNLREFAAFIVRAQAVRRMGAAAVDLAYVACGRYDAFWEPGLKAWDVAAGWLLIEEAGGVVTSHDGGPFDPFGGDICASNGVLHPEMVSVLKSLREEERGGGKGFSVLSPFPP
ncbi:MAG: Inositol-1-monophosphatase [Myxococcota bacterium]|nr:Inositol-1-monophosphatase [Myxococcota bacterium]